MSGARLSWSHVSLYAWFVHPVSFLLPSSSQLCNMWSLVPWFSSCTSLGFGVQLNGLKTEGKVPFAESFDQAQKNTFLRFINPFWRVSDALSKILFPTSQSMDDHLKVVDTFAREVAEKRRGELASGLEFRDLLSRFMTAHNNKGEPLNNDEVSQSITFLCHVLTFWLLHSYVILC